ncbi:MAG: DUF1365 domain-containing protein [Rhodospirillales bacterium]|jgi:DUF1365 family protein
MTLASAIYEGAVVHERVRPRRHRLRYGVFMMLLDLDELPLIDAKFRLFGLNRWAPLAFFDHDHGPINGEPLRPWIERQLEDADLKPDGGPIRLLCYPRIFGYVFNPISVYFCYRKDGNLSAILYEVCNTFKERHTYVIPVVKSVRPVIQQSCAKSHYVSPFIGMDADYKFKIIPPGPGVNIVIRQEDKDGLLLAASFQGTHAPITTSTMARSLIKFPFLTLKVMAGIHWEALRLWLKGLPVFPHRSVADPVQSTIIYSKTTRN